MTGWKFTGTVAGDQGVYLDNVSGIYTAPEGRSLPRFDDDGYARLCRCGLVWHQFEWHGCPGSEVEGPWLPLTLRDALRITLQGLYELPDDPLSLDSWMRPDEPIEPKSPIPKPSSKVPFWAYDANKSRRPRKRRGQPNNQRIA